LLVKENILNNNKQNNKTLNKANNIKDTTPAIKGKKKNIKNKISSVKKINQK
jgi:hypothetical protein